MVLFIGQNSFFMELNSDLILTYIVLKN